MDAPPLQDSRPDDATVFVDLDRCLLIDDSVSGSLARLVARGVARRRTLVKGLWMYTGYRMNWLDAEGLVAAGVSDLAGVAEAIVEEEAEAYFQQAARYRYRRAMLAELDLHRAAGRPIWLLTGGLPYLARRIAADLELDGVAATNPDIREGLFTGRLSERPCVGAGKIVHAQRVAQSLGRPLHRSWFYSDSYSDRPMLEVAEVPVAVNPDGKLRRLARQRGWRVVA